MFPIKHSSYRATIQTKLSLLSHIDFRLPSMDSYLKKIDLPNFVNLPREKLDEELKNFDALELFKAVKEMEDKIADIVLENHYLYVFLENNDPKALIGLNATRTSDVLSPMPMARPSRRSEATTQHVTSRPSITTANFSEVSGSHSLPRRRAAFYLNYRARYEMVEKCIADVATRTKDFEIRAMQVMKWLGARSEELKNVSQETRETVINFRLHFLRDEKDIAFLEKATERLIAKKLRDFVNNWIKSGNVTLGQIRLKTAASQDKCRHLQDDFRVKSDLNGLLGPVDFDLLEIKRTTMQNLFEEKTNHKLGIRDVRGKALAGLNQERKALSAVKAEMKQIAEKTNDIIRSIDKIADETEKVEDEISDDRKIMRKLKRKLRKYDAPSIDDYMDGKKLLLSLEKEERMLQRKIDIATMKLSNLMKRIQPTNKTKS